MIIRPITDVAEFEHCVELQREAFGWKDLNILPVRVLVVMNQIGGLTLGAFDSDQMIGFVNALPAFRNGELYWHSHMMAIQPGRWNSGVGSRLKLEQRAHALERGIRRIEWTFEPLKSKNAYLNIEKLGVVVRRYYADFYGPDIERVIAEWELDRPRPALEGEIRRVTIPADILTLQKQSPDSARDIHQRVRRQFLQNIAEGFFVAGFERNDEWSDYLFLETPPMLIKNIELREIRMQLLHPFETSFGVTTTRRIVLVTVSDGQHVGYGEVTAGEGPFYSHETTETAWHVLRDFIIPGAVGKELGTAGDVEPIVHAIRGHNMAKAGLETALWDLEARIKGVPLWRMLGGIRERIDCGVSIGIEPSVDKLLGKIDREVKSGYRRIKIKIKPGWDLDVIREVRQAFPSIRLMGDANSAYTLADIDLFRKMDEYDIMMFEQPLHYDDMIDHAELQKHIRTPICLDESIHSADDARKAIQIGACRIINIKLGRVGGHAAVRAVHDVCRASGIPVWCGGMLESGIGRAHNVALSSLENFSLPGDVSASQRYWTEDIIEPAVEVSPDGQITQRLEPGIGYEVKRDRIEKLTVRVQSFSA